jgi:hypothetical protein
MAPSIDTAPDRPETRTRDNYGDVALNLPPDWTRSMNMTAPALTLGIVGHENGIADAYLTKYPAQRHQFQWVHPTDAITRDQSRYKHYSYCTRTDWTKNPSLWDWDGEGYIVHLGQRLMARDERYFIEELEQEQERMKQRMRKTELSPRELAIIRKIVARGGIVEDNRGRPLVPLSSQRSSNTDLDDE